MRESYTLSRSFRHVPRIQENGEAMAHIQPSLTTTSNPNDILERARKEPTREDQIDEMLRERDSKYGTYYENSDFAESVKFLFHYHRNWKSLPNWMKYTIDMLIVKLSRIMSGDPINKDSWIDLVGYSKLGLNEVEKVLAQINRDEF